MTPSRTEPATFLFVVQHLNHYATQIIRRLLKYLSFIALMLRYGNIDLLWNSEFGIIKFNKSIFYNISVFCIRLHY